MRLNLCLSLFFLFASIIQLSAQADYDLILTKDLKMINAEITLLGDERIQYRLPDSAVIHEMSANKIIKVKLKNGKEHLYGEKPNANNTRRSSERAFQYPEYDEDLIAVIPFDFYESKSGRSLGKKGLEVQNFIIENLSNKGCCHNKILDTRETNARLLKAKINYSRLDAYTIEDLSNILGAGVIVTGGVKYNISSSSFMSDNIYSDGFGDEITITEEYSDGPISISQTRTIGGKNRSQMILDDDDIFSEGPDEIIITEEYGGRNYTSSGVTIEFSPESYDLRRGRGWYYDMEDVEFDMSTQMTVYKKGVKVFSEERDPIIKWGDADDWKGNVKWLISNSGIFW